MNDLTYDQLIDIALDQADPTKGNDLHRSLTTLWQAWEQVEPNTRESLFLAGARSQVLLWHGQLNQARAAIERMIRLADRLKALQLRRWAYDQLRLVNLCDTGQVSTP